jgi:hypothetical protein
MGLSRLRHFHGVLATLDRRRCYTIIAADDAYRAKAPDRFLGTRRFCEIVMHPHHDLDAHPGFVAMSGLRDLLNYRFFAERIGSERLAARIAAHIDPKAVARTRRRFPEFADFRAWVRRLEAATPAATLALRFVAQQRPDVMIVTPLLHFLNHHQVEYVKAAKQLGVPVIYGINSWDNATTKGDLFVMPDRTYVWNAFQAEEMEEFLDVAPESVQMLGAWRMDPFLQLSPSATRETLLRARGLEPGRRTAIYVCSSELAGDEERDFLFDWMQAVAGEFPENERPNLIVRPHPRRPLELAAVQRVWGANACVSADVQLLDEQDLYDELWISDAAVGVNTSAILQAVALGKPCLLPRCEAVSGMHAGLPHAEFLTRPRDGLLEMAPDMATHARDLAAVLRGEGGDRSERLARLSSEVIGCGEGGASKLFVASVIKDAGRLGRRNATRNRAPFPGAGDWRPVFRAAARFGVRGLDGRPMRAGPPRWAHALLNAALEAADTRNPSWRLPLFAGGEPPEDPGAALLQAIRHAAPGDPAVRRLALLAPRWPSLRSLLDALAETVLKDAGSRETYDLTRARWMVWHPVKQVAGEAREAERETPA